jgi:Fe-S-cluster containining protein
VRVPAIAKKSFDLLKNNPEYLVIVQDTLSRLKKLSNSLKRSKYIHKEVDEYVAEVFADPLVQKLSPCKEGCTACCHTQVSITKDEAELLARKIIFGGVEIDMNQLDNQARISADEYFSKLTFAERKCVFLDDNGACKVYADRPSVCRTNAVVGTKEQCDTSDGHKEMRLVLTRKADMIVYASFYFAEDSGTLPEMLQKALVAQKSVQLSCSE